MLRLQPGWPALHLSLTVGWRVAEDRRQSSAVGRVPSGLTPLTSWKGFGGCFLGRPGTLLWSSQGIIAARLGWMLGGGEADGIGQPLSGPWRAAPWEVALRRVWVASTLPCSGW